MTDGLPTIRLRALLTSLLTLQHMLNGGSARRVQLAVISSTDGSGLISRVDVVLDSDKM